MTCCVTMATKTASTPKHNKMTAAHCWSVHCLGSARMEALDSKSRVGVSRWRGSGVGVLKWAPGEKGPWMSAAEPSLLSLTAQTRTWYSMPGSSPSSLKWVLGPRYTCHKNTSVNQQACAKCGLRGSVLGSNNFALSVFKELFLSQTSDLTVDLAGFKLVTASHLLLCKS